MAEPAESGDHDAHSGEDAQLVRELLQSGIPFSRVAQLFEGRVSERDLDAIARDIVTLGAAPDPNLGLRVLERSTSAARNPEFLSQHVASLTAEAPQDLLDPLFFTLMKEPVVLSTGYVFDRSTVLDNHGTLKFSACPFTRATLKKDVYPLVEKRRKLQEFKEGRLDAMASTARRMLEEKSFDGFREVIEVAEQFLDDLGEETYIHKARQLAELHLEGVSSQFLEAPPLELAKIYIRIHRTLAENEVPAFSQRVASLEASARQALAEGRFDDAAKWCEACEMVQKSCKVGCSPARVRLEIARKRGEDLRLPRRVVYCELMSNKAAAEKFLQEEGLGIEDVSNLWPIALLKRRIDDHQMSDDWQLAIESPPLELEVEKVVVQARRFEDQGWGNQKGNLGLALYDAEGSLVERCNLFGTFRSPSYAYGNSPERTLKREEPVVAKARPGFRYRLEYTVGGGGGHEIHVSQLLCRVYPVGWVDDLLSQRYADPEGGAGLYVGPGDNSGQPHGVGRLEYDDNEVFVGNFSHGSMVEGIVYNGTTVKYGMREGRRESPGVPVGDLSARYPLEMDWLTADDDTSNRSSSSSEFSEE